MDKENETVDYSLIEDSFNPFPIAKSTELIDRQRPSPLGNATNSTFKLDLSQSGLSNLGDLDLTTSTRTGNVTHKPRDLNSSELSVQAGPDITPKNSFARPDSFFSTFGSKLNDGTNHGTPDFLRDMERDVNFAKLAKMQAAAEKETGSSRNSTRIDDINGDFHAYRTPDQNGYNDTSFEDSTPVRSNNSRPRNSVIT